MSNDAIDAVLNDAAQAFADFANGPVASTSATIERAVNASFNSVASTIARAAVSGKASMDEMVDAILADFDRVAIKDFIAKPVEGLVSSIASSLFDVAGVHLQHDGGAGRRGEIGVGGDRAVLAGREQFRALLADEISRAGRHRAADCAAAGDVE
jgi:phage-related minor tail protein